MDTKIEEMLECANRVHKCANQILASSGRQAAGTVVNEYYFVPLALLARALGHHRAIVHLVKGGFAVEAGVVALTQFELCLDVMYMSRDRSRATAWLQHESETRQPWNVAQKIHAVYDANPEMCEANHGAFRTLSQLKHVNPLAGRYGFPVRGSGPNLTIQTNPPPDETLQRWSVLVLGFGCHKLLEASRALMRCHAEFVEFDETVGQQLIALMAECRNSVKDVVSTLDLEDVVTHHGQSNLAV